jgi:(2Fe-2S) ferredoxin
MEPKESNQQIDILEAGGFESEGKNKGIEVKRMGENSGVWYMQEKGWTPGNYGRVSPEDVAQVADALQKNGYTIDNTIGVLGHSGSTAGVVFVTSKEGQPEQ